jgi:predicted 3-demethylubiquinone-9 3-methyltransferase (glyoxalase superfamily)
MQKITPFLWFNDQALMKMDKLDIKALKSA